MTHRILVVIVIASLAAACGAGRAARRGDAAARAGNWDVAVEHYRRAVQAKPNEPEYLIAYERAMITASQQHLDQARVAEARGQTEISLREYRRASEFDPTNRQVAAKVLDMERQLREQAEAARPSSMATLREQARQQGPAPLMNLNSIVEPIRFNNAQLREILSFIGQATNINVTYDSQFPDRAYSVQLEGVTLQEALDQILSANQLFYKVVNQRTILVAQDNNAKRQQYEDLVIKTYYLSNTDPTDMQQTINAVTRMAVTALAPVMAINKSNNSLTVRATESMMAVVDRIVLSGDKPRADVVIDVQIMEVNRRRAKQFGIDLANYTVNAAFSPEASAVSGAGALTSPPFNANSISRGINTADFYLAVPAALVRFLETDTETKLVAKTQLRGTEGSPLKLNLGDEIPVPTTTFAPIAQGGAAVNPLVSFTYKPVGINVETTTRVSYEGDIRLELIVESSTLGAPVSIAGQELPSFGSRKVTTVSRLREGESTLLAGLLRDDQRTILRGFPWVLRLPIIRQLFSSNDSSVEQSDLVMLLTPRIVRSHELTPQDVAPIYIGTMQNAGLTQPPAVINPDGTAAPAADVAPQAAPTPPAPAAPQAQAPPSPTAGSGQVVMSVPGTEFRVGGGPYTVPISITNASQVSAVSLSVTYNPAAVRVRTVQEGAFMRAGGVPAAFTQQSDAATGRVDIAISRTGDSTGVAGTGMLAALLLEAVGPGPVNLAITATATGPGGAPVTLQYAPVQPVAVK